MIKNKFRRWMYTGVIVVTLTAVGLVGWSDWPITTDSSQADPAVVLANEIGASNIKYTEGYAGTPGSRIHYVTAGQGEAIIFIHGFPSYWFTMFGLMEEFKSQYQVIAVDGLGVGMSDAPSSVDAYRIENLGKHLDTVIKELELDRVHLVGHDWGAAIATAYAQAYPSKVKTLTTMSALPHNIILSRVESDPKHRETFSYVSQFTRANPVLIKLFGVQNQIWEGIYLPFLEDGLISEQQAERFQSDIGKPRRLNRFINWYRANFPDFEEIDDSHYWPARDARVTVPAIFIYGDTDQVVTEAMVSDFQNSSDSLKVFKLKDIGHRPHYEEKATVVAAIRELITQD